VARSSEQFEPNPRGEREGLEGRGGSRRRQCRRRSPVQDGPRRAHPPRLVRRSCDYLTSHRNLGLDQNDHRAGRCDTGGRLPQVGPGRIVRRIRPPGSSSRRERSGSTCGRSTQACKHSACHIARVMAAEADAELAWARIFHVHGPGENERRLIPWVAGQIRAGIPVSLTDGTQVRTTSTSRTWPPAWWRCWRRGDRHLQRLFWPTHKAPVGARNRRRHRGT